MVIDLRNGWYKTSYRLDRRIKYYEACYSKIREWYLGGNDELSFVVMFPKKQMGNHYTYLNREELIEYIEEIAQGTGCPLISFSENNNFYLAQIMVPNDKRYILYVGTLMRYSFECRMALMTYMAFHNKELRAKMSIVSLIQFYLTYFQSTGIHTLDDAYSVSPIQSMKNWFSNNRDNFNQKCQYYGTRINNANWCSALHYMDTKSLPGLAICINKLINNEFYKHEKSLCCRRG